jgi:hypothetical protein
MNALVLKILHISCKIPPLNIDNSAIGDNPNIIVPVKYIVYESKIDTYQVQLKISSTHEICYCKCIMKIKKSREKHSKKTPEEQSIHYKDRVSVTHKKELVPLAYIFTKINGIKLIHSCSICEGRWSARLMGVATLLIPLEYLFSGSTSCGSSHSQSESSEDL